MSIARTELPVVDVLGELGDALASRNRAVLVAPPGAGKTTVVPLHLLDAPWLAGDRVLVLEPRRIAARASAARMAELLGESLGDTVGFRTRDEQKVGSNTRIEVITEAILVRMLQSDPALEGIGLVIADEVHERNLVTDLSLALALDAQQGLRPDLRILAMSATVEADRLATAMTDAAGPAPVVRSDGRAHHVDVVHRPPGPRDRLDSHVARVVATAIETHRNGDALVFLPGAADIRRVAQRLTEPGALPPDVDVCQLFGALSTEAQDAALHPSAPGRRRVILATDIAESSLTVPGVRIVVDAGLVRVPRVDSSSAMTRLQTEPASLASADQRAGRAGRLGPGVVYRLWDRAEAARRPQFAVPEIHVADLAGFALELAVWGAGPDELALLDQPPAGSWAQAQEVLVELGAIDDSGRPTTRGRSMADLPLHPRLAAAAVHAADHGHGWTGAVVAAVLEERDVMRGRPGELDADLVRRVELVADSTVRDGDADRRAVASARRRAEQIARRLGAKRGRPALEQVAMLVAVAYPDRVAQAQGSGGFRLRGGGGGRLAGSDPLRSSQFLAVARVEPGREGPMITLAAHLDETEVDQVVGSHRTELTTVSWDDGRNDVRARREVRAGALVLGSVEGPAPPSAKTTAVLIERLRFSGGALLRWTPAARGLQQRMGFLHQRDPQGWPDVSDRALLADLEVWLVAFAPALATRRDLEKVDMVAALRSRLGRDAGRVASLAPTSFEAAGGRAVAIDYATGEPRASVRVQDLFGTTVHPTVYGGQVPVVLELLSPARRPIQVTADLAGFWSGSWGEVRKEMAGRYPKHPWPADPAASSPPPPRRRR